MTESVRSRTILTIRERQLDALRWSLLQDFERRLAGHVGDVFPDRVAAMGEDETRALVRHGVEQARRYGIERERDVGLFVDLMFGLGRDFLGQPAMAWIVSILTDRLLSGERKIDAVYAQLDARLGPDAG